MVTKFINDIFGKNEKGYITVWTLPDKKCKSFAMKDKAQIDKFVKENKESKDIYFGIGARKENFAGTKRGKAEDISSISCLWYDLDVKGSAHKQTALPETKEEGLQFLRECGYEPSIVIDSGNGLHCYWLLENYIGVATEKHRENISNLMSEFQKQLNQKAKERGWVMDNTSDIARVLRLPGSINHKNGTECKVIGGNGERYSLDKFLHLVRKEETQTKKQYKQNERAVYKGETGCGDKCIDKCKFLQYCKEHSSELPEPYWHAMISNLALASDGVELCHELSREYKGYSKAETEDKVQRARKESKPHTCKYIRESLGFDCGKCDSQVKSPIGFGVITKLEKAQTAIKKEFANLEDVYDEAVLDALAYLKQNSMKDYSLFKANIKSKHKNLNLVEFEKTINQQILKSANKLGGDGEELKLDGISLGEATMPDKYIVDMQSIKKIVQTGESVKIFPICNCPIVIQNRFINLDSKNEKIGLAYFVDGKWKDCIGNRADIFNKTTLMKFSNKGLKVSTTNAGELVSYLDSYEGVNMENITIKKSIDRLGWVGDDTFFPYVTGDITFETDSVHYAVYEDTKPSGTREKWLDLVTRARENVYARSMISASVASALIEKMGVRNFMLHVWDDSKAGKTAILKLALSLWGNPTKLMGTFYTTEVALEQRAAMLNNLPLGIDEKQVGNKKRIDFEKIIYMLCSGESKSRGQREGGVQQKRYWRNISMSTGEEPLLKGNAKDGSNNRCMQINGRPIDNEVFGKEIHNKLSRHYGFGGSDIIEYVCKKQKTNPDYVEELYSEFADTFSTLGCIDSYVDYCSAMCVGDYFVSKILFDASDEDAKKEAMEMAMVIYNNAQESISGTNGERGVEFVKGWLVSNINRFQPDSTPCFGKVDGGKFTVIPEYLNNALDEAGFTPSTVIKALGNRGLLVKCEYEKGKNRTKTRATFSGVQINCYVIKLESDEIKPLVRE